MNSTVAKFSDDISLFRRVKPVADRVMEQIPPALSIVSEQGCQAAVGKKEDETWHRDMLMPQLVKSGNDVIKWLELIKRTPLW